MISSFIEYEGISLFTESVGDPADPTVLLIMGATASGVWWPEEFCTMLAQQGLFVIRYDHRDTGASTSCEPGNINYKVEDLADDAIRVLNGYKKSSAHLVGMSLGGLLAQLVALKYPTRVQTLTMIASERLAAADPSMPGISPSVLEYHAQAGTLDWSDRETVVKYLIGAWKLLSGSAHQFDPALIGSMAEEDFARTPNLLTAFNHAQLQDPAEWCNRLQEIQHPALIIHGTEDIVLPYEHAAALHAELPNSRLLTLEGTGHELPRGDWADIVGAIVSRTRD
ncbi:MAG: alpha/beta fold hydrolase [Idiomarina sp.]|nr:alpha/beta fold hydrolase [Idiomarina sp.]